MRRTKKNAISARIPAASTVRIPRRTRSPDQVLRLGASNAIALNLERAPVARQRAGGRLRLRQQVGRQLGEVQLVERRLAVAEAVVQERLERLGVALRRARLARVLVDVDERLRRDRVGVCA